MWKNGWVSAPISDLHLLICAAGAVVLLLALILRLKVHPALALTLAAGALGVSARMAPAQVPLAFFHGLWNLMAHIAVVLCLGAVLGNLLARSGGAESIGGVLVNRCGPRWTPLAMLALGLVVGLPVFFEVGVVLMMPIVAAAAHRAGRPAILAGLPLLAGLSIVHGTLPPHPAALLATAEYHADMGRTILLGLLVAIPSGIVAGPLLQAVLIKSGWGTRWLVRPEVSPAIDSEQNVKTQGAPHVGFLRAMFTILLPVGLIFAGSWADTLAPDGSLANTVLTLAGRPQIALLVAVLAALVLLGPAARQASGAGMGIAPLCGFLWQAIKPILSVLVILAAAGGLSGILRESGAAQATVRLAVGAHMPPLVLAWTLAAVVRVAMGSATVAMAVAAGVLAPAVASLGVRPELLVLATGTGSLILSHVNDPGFWMIQSFFRLELKQSFSTWTAMETLLSLTGLAVVLLLSGVVR